MLNPNTLMRIPLEKNLFWHGILQLNENGGQTFFDVRYKKSIPTNNSLAGLYTNDIPPFPLNSTDTLTVTFMLENNQGTTTNRTPICETSISGTDLQKALEEQETDSGTIVVTMEMGEWQFQLLEKTWCLRAVMAYAPISTLKQIIKDL